MKKRVGYAGFRKKRRDLLAALGLVAVLVPGFMFLVYGFSSGNAVRDLVRFGDSQSGVAPEKNLPSEVEKSGDPGMSPTGKEDDEEPEPARPLEEPEKLDTRKLYGEVADIVESHEGEYGVAIYDPESRRGILYNGEEVYDAASIGKLPVLATLYREAASGKLELDERMTIQYPDVQSYGTGVLHYRPVGTELSLGECAYHLIKDSDNTAWTMLYRRLTIEKVSDELPELGASDSEYDSYGRLYTDASDTLQILKKIQDSDYTNQKLSDEMLSLMTDTAFEGRLPQPLPKDGGVEVAHKIGSNDSTFADAGIVFYEKPEGSSGEDFGKDPDVLASSGGRSEGEDPHYYVVVLAKETTGLEATDAMRKISLAAYRAIA